MLEHSFLLPTFSCRSCCNLLTFNEVQAEALKNAKAKRDMPGTLSILMALQLEHLEPVSWHKGNRSVLFLL